MNQLALQTVCQAVFMALSCCTSLRQPGEVRLLHPFTTDENRVAGFVQHAVQSGFCEAGIGGRS